MTGRLCRKHDVEPGSGSGRCVLEWGHARGARRTKHDDGAGHTWGEDWTGADTPQAKARVREKSVKQDARDNAWLRALCYVRLVLQSTTGNWYGIYRCESCGEEFSDDILVAVQRAQPCHVIPRKEGDGVRFYASGEVRSFGLDTFENVRAGCSSCNLGEHLAERADPQWTPRVVGGAS